MAPPTLHSGIRSALASCMFLVYLASKPRQHVRILLRSGGQAGVYISLAVAVGDRRKGKRQCINNKLALPFSKKRYMYICNSTHSKKQKKISCVSGYRSPSISACFPLIGGCASFLVGMFIMSSCFVF